MYLNIYSNLPSGICISGCLLTHMYCKHGGTTAAIIFMLYRKAEDNFLVFWLAFPSTFCPGTQHTLPASFGSHRSKHGAGRGRTRGWGWGWDPQSHVLDGAGGWRSPAPEGHSPPVPAKAQPWAWVWRQGQPEGQGWAWGQPQGWERR